MTTPLYDDSNWRSEYIDIKSRQLSSRQVQLLESGADSLASSWFLQAMYNDWKKAVRLYAPKHILHKKYTISYTNFQIYNINCKDFTVNLHPGDVSFL